MKTIADLNEAIAQLTHNRTFMDLYQRRVIEEKQQPLPIWQPLEIFAQMAAGAESALTEAAALVNVEKPTKYLLMDALTLYIKGDSRFEPIRKSIPFCQ